MKRIQNTKTTKKTKKIIGAVTTYHGDEHRYLKGHKVRIVAVLKNAAKPDIDVDGPEYANIDDEEELRSVGGVTANDRIEVQPYLKEEGRFSFVTSDPKATDLARFKTLRKQVDTDDEGDRSRSNRTSKSKSPKQYPVQFHGETRYVTVPGTSDQQPGPANEIEFEKFLAEAIEAYSEASDIARPHVTSFSEKRAPKNNHGLVVRIGESEYQLTIVRSR